MNRRYVLTSAAAVSLPLAGCSGSTPDESAPPNGSEEASDGDDGDDNGSENQTESTEDAAPTLDDFDYPDGARQDGVDGATLFGTHESTLVEAGSLTHEGERTDVFDDNEFSQTQTSKFDDNAVSREVTENGETERVWSPADEDVAYVRMESGFEQAYRVDERAPPTDEVTGLSEFRRYISEVEWGAATELVETAGGLGVVYESVGYSERLSFGEMREFDASITVSDSGFVSQLEYDQTELQGGETIAFDVTAAITAVGDTSVDEPDWADAAREQGVRFDVAFTDDGTAFRVEMTGGDDVSRDARIRLRDERGSASSRLSEPLSVGDVLFVGLSESGGLLIDESEAPAEARPLAGDLRLTVRTEFPLLTHTRRP
ncbi:DUF7537 family lipoprotein [Halorubrum ezzemoulense]|uniref:Uncharacterized protein n=1 Tax=Halorubrum ezzemoulense TaxID=337243 RepID=A0A256K180_HALEZ|nr:hypothetical protein [Halorubrum ezzemoulense]OYR74770.1 hypothetical protein DJ76_05325 [Halorubrum ezzemoulense]